MKRFMKVLVVMVALLMVTGIVSGCGGGGQKSESPAPAPTPAPESTAPAEDDSSSESDATNVQWKEFLDDYEAWVDKYIALLEKYIDNPTDATLMSEYLTLSQEVMEWATRADEVEAELASTPEALSDYLSRLANIIKKLEKVQELTEKISANL